MGEEESATAMGGYIVSPSRRVCRRIPTLRKSRPSFRRLLTPYEKYMGYNEVFFKILKSLFSL